MGNTHENITPLSSAVHNAGYFANSSILVQNSYGNCSTTTPSVCAAGVRRRNLQKGEPPRNGIVYELILSRLMKLGMMYCTTKGRGNVQDNRGVDGDGGLEALLGDEWKMSEG